MKRFVDRVALVTGGGGAIGSAASTRLAEEGAQVVVVDVDTSRAEAAVSAVKSAGGTAIAVTGDVGDPSSVTSIFATALSHLGQIDVVFNNAGIAGTPAPIDELEVAELDEVLRVNLRGSFLVLRASVRAMAKAGRGDGAIVNMASSIAGWDVLAGGSAYAASKYGVLGLTRGAALDAARYGIRVNAVCPGVIETKLGIPDLEQSTTGRDRFAMKIPLRRVGTPADVAAVVAFLASDDARHVTGASVLIDGGQTLQSWSNAPPTASFPLASDQQQEQSSEGGTS